MTIDDASKPPEQIESEEKAKRRYERWRQLEVTLRAESKQTLLFYIASKIMWGVRFCEDEALAEAEIVIHLEAIRHHRDNAREENRHRRFMSRMERYKADLTGQPSGRKRRRSKKRKDI